MSSHASHADPIRLILIDDDATDREAVARALTQSRAERYRIEPFETVEEGLERLLAGPADCVLLAAHDSRDDGFAAFEILTRLQSADVDVPVILLIEGDSIESVGESNRHSDYDHVTRAALEPDGLAAQIRMTQRLHEANRRTHAAEAEVRRLLEQLRRAAAARDSVLAVVSHDLRGPLNNIELAMGLLEENVSGDQRALAIASVHRAIARADRLIGDLLDVVRLDGGGIDLLIEPIEPRGVVDAAVADVQVPLEQHGVTLSVDVGDRLGSILADRDRVVRVLDKLLRNAIKFGPRGGEVLLSVRRLVDCVEFAVRDLGPGLDAQTQAHVFDRFWRTKDHAIATGSGLGLAIARGIVHGHGGMIGVESMPGRGARFYFTIPSA